MLVQIVFNGYDKYGEKQRSDIDALLDSFVSTHRDYAKLRSSSAVYIEKTLPADIAPEIAAKYMAMLINETIGKFYSIGIVDTECAADLLKQRMER